MNALKELVAEAYPFASCRACLFVDAPRKSSSEVESCGSVRVFFVGILRQCVFGEVSQGRLKTRVTVEIMLEVNNGSEEMITSEL